MTWCSVFFGLIFGLCSACMEGLKRLSTCTSPVIFLAFVRHTCPTWVLHHPQNMTSCIVFFGFFFGLSSACMVSQLAHPHSFFSGSRPRFPSLSSAMAVADLAERMEHHLGEDEARRIMPLRMVVTASSVAAHTCTFLNDNFFSFQGQGLSLPSIPIRCVAVG